MIGAIGRMAGLDFGKMAGNVVNNMFGNSQVGNLAGSIAQGLTSFLGGDAFGMFNAAKNAFSTIGSGFRAGGGNPAMFGGGSRLPMLPQMSGGLGAMSPMMGGFGGNNSLGAAASTLGQMKSTRGKMEALMANKNMSPEDKQLASMQLQQEMQSLQQMITMLTQMSKNFHTTQMAILRNI